MDGKGSQFCIGTIRKIQKVYKSLCKDNQCASCHLNPDFLLHSLANQVSKFLRYQVPLWRLAIKGTIL